MQQPRYQQKPRGLRAFTKMKQDLTLSVACWTIHTSTRSKISRQIEVINNVYLFSRILVLMLQYMQRQEEEVIDTTV